MTIGPVTTPGVYTYGANCVGPGGSGTATVIVTVGEVAAPTISICDHAGHHRAGRIGAHHVVRPRNANGCTGSSGNGASDWEGAQPTQDSAGFNTKAVSTVGQYAYNLTCLGPGGSTQVTGILTVDPAAVAAAPTVTFARHAQRGATGAGYVVLLDHDGRHRVQCQRRQRGRRVARCTAGEQQRYEQRGDRGGRQLFVYVDVYRRRRQYGRRASMWS